MLVGDDIGYPWSPITVLCNVPRKTTSEFHWYARSIFDRPGFNTLLFITHSGTTPQRDVVASKRVMRIKQKRLVRLMRIDVNDVPCPNLKRL